MTALLILAATLMVVVFPRFTIGAILLVGVYLLFPALAGAVGVAFLVASFMGAVQAASEYNGTRD